MARPKTLPDGTVLLGARVPVEVDHAINELVALHEISKWMGHASYATTVDLYGHLLDATPDMDAMDSLMSTASASVAPLRSIG